MSGGLDAVPMCRRYLDDPDVLGYCIQELAGGFPDRATVEEPCPLAGQWEAECRHAWVAGRMHPGSGFSTDELLATCGDSVDCRFELLDFRPAADVLVQLERCRQYAGKYTDDCAGHALQRWRATSPDAAEVERVASAQNRFEPQVGSWVSVIVACDHTVDDCLGTPGVRKWCRQGVQRFRANRQGCPPKERVPMHPGSRPRPAPPPVSPAPRGGPTRIHSPAARPGSASPGGA